MMKTKENSFLDLHETELLRTNSYKKYSSSPWYSCYHIWLNMELDPQSLFWLHMHSCTHWLRPRNPPPQHAFGLIYEGSIGQPR